MATFVQVTSNHEDRGMLVNLDQVLYFNQIEITAPSPTGGSSDSSMVVVMYFIDDPQQAGIQLKQSYEEVALLVLAATSPPAPPTVNMLAGDEKWAPTATELKLPENNYE